MNQLKKTISASVLSILKSLVKLMIRKGVSCQEFEELVRRAYVDVAEKDFPLEGKKQTGARISVLTGLSRKEVLRLQRLPEISNEEYEQKYNRASRVLTAWLRDKNFCTSKGEPKILYLTDKSPSFHDLVKEYSGDIPYRAILDEFERNGIIERLPKDRIKLVERGYIPNDEEEAMINILGEDCSLLVDSIDFNIENRGTRSYFQKKVAYKYIDKDQLAEFRKYSSKKCQALLEEFDKKLAKIDLDEDGDQSKQAGIGIYYFEKENEAQNND